METTARKKMKIMNNFVFAHKLFIISSLLLSLITSYSYSTTNDDILKRKYAKYIVDDQKEATNICWYYTGLLQKNANLFINNNRTILPDSTIQTIQTIIGEYMNEIWHYEKDYKELIIQVYMSYYTTSELKKLKKFWASPLGAKLHHVQSDINNQIYKQANPITQQIIDNLTRKLEPYLKEKELERLLTPQEM